tara:strand:+ start:527 stop:1300 length:774 start_codon:yes stop_codon:yes gene_type:complete
MKRIKIIFLLIISFVTGISQNNATDFTALDCDGTSHHLFSELDSGKVIVIAWVMPCGPCGSIALDAYTASLGYTNSNPGRLAFYLVDDFANTNCQSLFAWADNFGMGNCTMFSDPSIDMGDYGQIGMPKIVVLGGAGHYVYFNENSSAQNINSAIDLALTGASVTTTINDKKKILNFHCYPNPANGEFKINYNFKNESYLIIELYNLLGEKMMVEKLILESFNGEYSVNTQNLPNGTYLLRLSNGHLQNSQILNIFH